MLCQLVEAFKNVNLVHKFHALKKANPQADSQQADQLDAELSMVPDDIDQMSTSSYHGTPFGNCV